MCVVNTLIVVGQKLVSIAKHEELLGYRIRLILYIDSTGMYLSHTHSHLQIFLPPSKKNQNKLHGKSTFANIRANKSCKDAFSQKNTFPKNNYSIDASLGPMVSKL